MERKLVDSAVDGTDAGGARIDDGTLAAVLDRHRYLGDEQAEMVGRLTTGPVGHWITSQSHQRIHRYGLSGRRPV